MTKKIKIAYVSNFPHFKMGGQRSMLELIENLDRERIEPFAIVPEKGELSEKLETMNVPVYFNKTPKLKPKHLLSIIKALFGFRRIFKKEQIDIVHPDMERDTVLAGLAKIFTKTKMVWHVRLTRESNHDWINFTLADGVIGISEAVGRRFKNSANFSRKYQTIFNGTSLERFKPPLNKGDAKAKIGLDRSKFYILFVGQLKEGKGLYDLFEAAEMLKDKPNVRFLLCGNALSQEKALELENYVVRKKLTNISFKGHQEDINKWMQASECLILPSHEGVEGMGRVLFEAMACGCVPIGTMISGISEAITIDTGILVPQKNPNAIKDAICTLRDEAAILEKFSKNGVQRAKEEFDIKIHAKHVMDFYNSILGR